MTQHDNDQRKVFLSLPERLQKSSQDLTVVNISGYAWRKQDALEVIEFLRQGELAVLGVEAFELKKGQPELTYHIWSAKSKSDQIKWCDFVNLTCTDARKFISTFKEQGKDIIYNPSYVGKARYEIIKNMQLQYELNRRHYGGGIFDKIRKVVPSVFNK